MIDSAPERVYAGLKYVDIYTYNTLGSLEGLDEVTESDISGTVWVAADGDNRVMGAEKPGGGWARRQVNCARFTIRERRWEHDMPSLVGK